ncbi:MAG: hypothetical protein IKC93_05390 [Candidatus Methanomethylophilaceae archaeon]|nr:hypothetical protein [Candidatus Methanomethylophilaceae archaeon]
MTSEIPVKVEEAGLVEWYQTLSDLDRVKLRKYIDKVDSTSQFSFFISLIRAAVSDENYRFGVSL